MLIDEPTVIQSLHDIDAEAPAGLLATVRRGGRRRMLRRRAAYSASGVVALAAVGGAVATAATHHGTGASLRVTTSPTHSSGLYADPPPAGSHCNGGYGGHANPSHYPQLLLLPRNQQVSYAFTRADSSACVRAHVALTLLDTAGATIQRGLVVEGPDAPTATEAAYEGGPNVGFGGQSGHHQIRGNPGSEFTIRGFTNAFWTEPDGGQWQAEATGMSQQAAVHLLDRLSLDSSAGTATLPDAGSQGWTVAPATADEPAGAQGTLLSQWPLPSGNKADLTVTAGPDRTDQQAAGSAPRGSFFTTVDGHRAVASYSSQFATLVWQQADNVQVELDVEQGTIAEARQAASTLAMTTPRDPRIHG